MSSPQLQATNAHAALHIAAEEGVVSSVEALIERIIRLHMKTKYGETALHLAAANGHLRVLKILASRSPEHVLNAKDHNGWTVAHRKVISCNEELVVWLLRHPSSNFDLRDKHGRRAVAFAAAYGSKETLNAVLTHRPDDILHADMFGNTIVHMAAFGGNLQNLAFLSIKDGVGRPGENRSGKTIVGLAPTLEIDRYLHGLGFNHSPRFSNRCLDFYNTKPGEVTEEPKTPANSDTCMELVRSVSDRELQGHESGHQYTDTLGRRFGSIYMLD